MSRFLLAAGGTGGHLYPALAVALALRERGEEVHFSGEAEGMEAQLVPRYGFPFHPLPRFHVAVRGLLTLQWLKGWRAAAHLLRTLKPQALLLAGGRTCVLVGMAASWGRPSCPILLLEQNAVPGRANRWLARRRGTVGVACTFEESLPYFPPSLERRATGCPVRPHILQATRQEGIEALGLDPKRRTLLVLGGSRGAPALHQAILEALPLWAQEEWFVRNAQVVHIGGWVNRPQGAEQQRFPWYRYLPYLEEMGWALATADLALARAGASGLAELGARGVPAVLVPWPQAKDRHQEANARVLQQRGGVLVLPEAQCQGPIVATLLRALLADEERLAQMASAMRTWGKPDAAERVADWLQELANSRGGCISGRRGV